MATPRIGLACPNPGERAAFIEWCNANKFRPVPMIDAGSIQRELAGEGFEALVIDADLAVKDSATALRHLGPNRPVIVVGNGDRPPAEIGRRDDAFLSRPVERESFVFALIMALAEGRPARQSPRRLVARLQATVDGAPAKLIDVSTEGIRLELPAHYRSTIAPVVNVAVPTFNVSVVGRRVWINTPLEQSARNAFWCGVRLERNPQRAVAAWQILVENAPASLTSESLHYL